jgi:predicted nuclease of predicted toxin-antitoxin system
MRLLIDECVDPRVKDLFPNLKMGIIVAKVPRNQLRHYQTIQSQLQEAIQRALPGVVIYVRCS